MMKGDAKEGLAAASRHQAAGRIAEAEAICRRIIARNPTDADAIQLLGGIAIQSGRLDEAVDLLRKALGIRPNWAEAYNNLGVALDFRGQWVKAENAFRAATRLKPQFAQAHANLGNVLRRQCRPCQAADAYRRALHLDPNNPAAHNGLGAACIDLGRLPEAIDHYRTCRDLQPTSAPAHSDLLFWLLHDPDVTPKELFDEHLRWAERHERPLRPRDPVRFDNLRDTGRPIRVGYVSPDFREHTVARFIEPILRAHDPSRVTAVCYSDVIGGDDVTRRIRASVPEWRDSAALSNERLVELIRADCIDVLVDLTGHMGHNRLQVFALRAAPVQVTYMAYPHSTGLAEMDWRITDADCDPPRPHRPVPHRASCPAGRMCVLLRTG